MSAEYAGDDASAFRNDQFTTGCVIGSRNGRRARMRAFGGDVMMRAIALEAVGGYRDDVIAAEDDELCVRLRAAGWRVWRLNAEMTLHDAAMVRFGQWWRRTMRERLWFRARHLFAWCAAGAPFRLGVASCVALGRLVSIGVLGGHATLWPWGGGVADLSVADFPSDGPQFWADKPPREARVFPSARAISRGSGADKIRSRPLSGPSAATN